MDKFNVEMQNIDRMAVIVPNKYKLMAMIENQLMNRQKTGKLPIVEPKCKNVRPPKQSVFSISAAVIRFK